jgi:mannose-6-phosphate isomerase-like protein (cupin superfamily)
VKKPKPYRIERIVEVGGPGTAGQASWHMLRSELGIEAFGVNAWSATEAGQTVVSEHDELEAHAGGHEELYVVLTGSATFVLDGAASTVPAGSVVFVRDPAVKRSAVADSAGTTVLAIGAAVGKPFVVSQWERSAEALRYWPSEEWDEAIRLLTLRLAETPDNAGMIYNLACAEARSGRPDDALEHLARALEFRPELLKSMQHDPDLEPIRDDPRFPRLPAD